MSQPTGNEPVATTPEPQNEPVKDTPTSTLSHEDALKELAKVRAEAAARRVANKELEEQAKKWKEYEDSQKSELQKLQDAVAERDKRIAEKELEVTRSKIASEFNVDTEDLDLLVGDEASMRRIAGKIGKKNDEGSRPLDLLAGNRGAPVSKSTQSTGNFMDNLIRGNRN